MAKRVSGWSFRLQQEGKRAISSFFVTLTYQNDQLVYSPNGFRTLDKTHVQKFLKRLRKISPKEPKIKYYACGEYGSLLGRPHYHLIIFNADADLIEKAWSYYNEKTGKYKRIGKCYFGTVTGASIGYVLKYMTKIGTVGKFARDDREREFSLMSKQLGLSYVTKQMQKWHSQDLEKRNYLPYEGDKKIPMPRYYKLKIYNSEQIGILKGSNEKQAAIRQAEYEEKFGENWRTIQADQTKAAFEEMYKKAHKGRKNLKNEISD